ncbi:protein kinase domain-containing protein, partial [Haematococcus lacustris]
MQIGDLGIARSLNEGSEFAHSILGTPYYLAPELCEDKPYNTKSDMWALGVVLYECCTGHYPFEAQNQGALLRKILKGQYAPISGPYTGNLVQLVCALLTFRPEQRPDTAAILRNPTVVAKAQALGIDLNPRPTGLVEDRPVYQQQQSEEQMAGPGLPLPSHQQGAHHYQQQQQYYPVGQAQLSSTGKSDGAAGSNAGTGVNMERQRQQLQGNVHNGRKDNMKGLLGQPQAPTPVNNRLQPEALPAAGARAGGAHGGSPFALHHATPDVQTQSRMQSSQ